MTNPIPLNKQRPCPTIKTMLHLILANPSQTFVAATFLLLVIACVDTDMPLSGKALETCAARPNCGGQMYVIDRLIFATVAEDGSVAGFNIDNLVSDGQAAADCHSADYTGPDGSAGIDNQVAKLLDAIGPGYADQVPETIQSLISGGGLMLLLEVIGSGKPGSKGALVTRSAEGIPLVGTDNMLLSHQTFTLAPEPLLAATDSLIFNDNGAQIGPYLLDLRFRFLATRIRLPFHAAQATYTTNADGSLAGLLGAYIAVSDALGAASFVGGDDAELGAALQAILPTLADVRGDDDKCSGISIALSFHAVPAYVFDTPAAEVDTSSPEYLFEKATCGGCHKVSGVVGAQGFIGPNLDGLGDRAANAVTGQTAQDYVREAILDPAAYIAPGYDDTMPENLARFLSADELEILVAWLAER